MEKPEMNLSWTLVVNESGHRRTWSENVDLHEGENHIVVDNVHGIIESAEARIVVPMGESSLYMNGFQTWSWNPEFHKNDRMPGLQNVPKFLIDKYSFDRYGDYHFVSYPKEKGKFHGFSWCAFNRGMETRLFASLDEHPGYTIFRYDARTEVLSMERDTCGVRVDGSFHLLDLFYQKGKETEVYDNWFSAMHITPLTAEKLYGYSSWYNRYQNIDENGIMKDLEGCTDLLEKGDLFQIDDGWEPFVGDWLEPDQKKFPNGMKAAADAIHAKGFKAGIWLAPFAAETDSRLFHEHPDWFIQKDGKPWIDGCNWSGFYGLDIDQPAVIDYLEKVFHRITQEWGFDLVKLDFLYAAAPFGSEKESRAARMYRAIELLRKWCGKTQILGCGVPVMPAFGRFEYCRLSCDVSLDRDDKFYMRHFHRERTSTIHAVETSMLRRMLNGRAYLGDPDVFFLRNTNIRLTKEEKTRLGELDALLYGVFMTSDDPGEYTEEMKQEYRRLRHLTKANVLSVDHNDGVTILYELDGKTHSLHYDQF